MPAERLTARRVESIKKTGKPQSFADADAPGLELRVSAAGRKVWSVRFRNQTGTQRRITLGPVAPTGSGGMDLKAAREATHRLIGRVLDGQDPAAEKRLEKLTSKAEPIKTFGQLVDAYWAACESGEYQPRSKVKRARTLNDERGVWERHLKGRLAKVRLEDMSAPFIEATLRALTVGSGPRAGRPLGAQGARALQVIRQALAYAVKRGRLPVNHAAGTDYRPEIKPRERRLSDVEVGMFWRALEQPEQLRTTAGDRLFVGKKMALALQILMLTGTRRNEVAGMRLDELDLAQPGRETWQISANRHKAGVGLLVPLPPAAAARVRQAIALKRDKTSPFVFENARDLHKPMTPDAITHAMAGAIEAVGIPSASPHDLRRTAAHALVARCRVLPAVVSLVLGHSNDGGGAARVTREHYMQYSFYDERHDALSRYEAHVLACAEDAPPKREDD